MTGLIPPSDKILILALRSLVRERQYRVLRKKRTYSLEGAICSVTWAATKGTSYSHPGCLQAVRRECGRLTKMEGVNHEQLLQAAVEWESLPDGLPPTAMLVVTPAFATLLRAARPKRVAKATHQQPLTASLF